MSITAATPVTITSCDNSCLPIKQANFRPLMSSINDSNSIMGPAAHWNEVIFRKIYKKFNRETGGGVSMSLHKQNWPNLDLGATDMLSVLHHWAQLPWHYIFKYSPSSEMVWMLWLLHAPYLAVHCTHTDCYDFVSPDTWYFWSTELMKKPQASPQVNNKQRHEHSNNFEWQVIPLISLNQLNDTETTEWHVYVWITSMLQQW